MSNSSIWPVDRTLSAGTSLGKTEPGGEGIERAFHIPESSSIIRFLVSYLGNTLVGVFPLWSDTAGVFYSPTRLGLFN